MEAVIDMGGSTSQKSSSRLKFPLTDPNGQNTEKMVDLTELIKIKEEERRRKETIKSMKKKCLIEKIKKKDVDYYLNDERTGKRKKRLVKKFTKDSVKLRRHHSKKSKQLKKEILLTLKKMFQLEREVEELRQDLVLRPDFVVAQLYAFFDITGKSRVSLLEFYNGLIDLGIVPNKEDLTITVKEFDKSSRGYLDYEDMFRMVAPQDKQFKNILVERHKRCPVSNFEDVSF